MTFVFSDYIQDKYHYHPRKASYVAGAAYDVSMVMSPFLGGVIVRKTIIIAIFLSIRHCFLSSKRSP